MKRCFPSHHRAPGGVGSLLSVLKIPSVRGVALSDSGRASHDPPQGLTALTPEAVKKLNGRDALLRVRDGKLNTDAEPRPYQIRSLRRSEFFHSSPLERGIGHFHPRWCSQRSSLEVNTALHRLLRIEERQAEERVFGGGF